MKTTDRIQGYLYVGTTYAAVFRDFISFGSVHFSLSLIYDMCYYFITGALNVVEGVLVAQGQRVALTPLVSSYLPKTLAKMR